MQQRRGKELKREWVKEGQREREREDQNESEEPRGFSFLHLSSWLRHSQKLSPKCLQLGLTQHNHPLGPNNNKYDWVWRSLSRAVFLFFFVINKDIMVDIWQLKNDIQLCSLVATNVIVSHKAHWFKIICLLVGWVRCDQMQNQNRRFYGPYLII